MVLSARNSKVIELVHNVSHNDMSQPSPQKMSSSRVPPPSLETSSWECSQKRLLSRVFAPLSETSSWESSFATSQVKGFHPVVGYIIREYFQKTFVVPRVRYPVPDSYLSRRITHPQILPCICPGWIFMFKVFPRWGQMFQEVIRWYGRLIRSHDTAWA